MISSSIARCDWAGSDPLYIEYHDTEWGVPLHQDLRLFEMLILEGAQAGLSWITVLRKRPAYRLAFDGFDPQKVAVYDADKVTRLLADSGIIRNRAKIASAISNAQAFLKIQAEFGSFDAYLWGFVGHQPKVNRWETLKQAPPETRESQALSKDLKTRGFRFVGPTICYAFMQATGLVQDHLVGCFRYKELSGTSAYSSSLSC
ncbi:MAG: DNA-3-methyladenine glycosylase I [Anaerolineales bacterium]